MEYLAENMFYSDPGGYRVVPIETTEQLAAADIVHVVRCGKCRYSRHRRADNTCVCYKWYDCGGGDVPMDGFCFRGEPEIKG